MTNEERTGSDRPAELVTRDRDQVGTLDMGGKVDPPQRLDGIGVEPRAGSVTSGDLDERRDVVHHPRLVVDGHDRHDRDGLAGGVENRGEPVGGDGAVGLEFDCEAPCVLHRFEHGVMFTGRADGDPTLRVKDAANGEVVGLAAPGREHDLGWRPIERSSDLVASIVERPASGARCPVGTGRVGVMPRRRIEPGRLRLGAQRGARCVVEIDLDHLGVDTRRHGISLRPGTLCR